MTRRGTAWKIQITEIINEFISTVEEVQDTRVRHRRTEIIQDKIDVALDTIVRGIINFILKILLISGHITVAKIQSFRTL